jgi:hypothetical protein
MHRFLAALIGLAVGYAVGAFAGYWAIELFSDNRFDRSVEAATTAVFVFGPGGAVTGCVAGVLLGGPRRRRGKGPDGQAVHQKRVK